MDYYEFKDTLKKTIENEFKDCTVTEECVSRINSKMTDAFKVLSNNSNAGIYYDIESAYEDYTYNNSFKDILHTCKIEIASEIDNLNNNTEIIKKFLTGESFDSLIKSGNVILQVINFNKNKEYLDDIYYRIQGDVAIIPTILPKLPKSETDVMNISIPINKKMFDLLNRNNESVDLIFDKLLDTTFKTSNYYIRILNFDGCKDLSLDAALEEYEKIHLTTSIISVNNSTNYLGANCILYPEIFEKFANITESNIYILPSSRHEVIIMDSNIADKEELHHIVKATNQYELSEKDFLSDNVYMYNIKTKQIEMVTGKNMELELKNNTLKQNTNTIKGR